MAFGGGCKRVYIKDAEWCGDMGPLGAQCFHIKSANKRRLDKDHWNTERFGMVCTKSTNFANWKATLLKLCAKTKMCDYEVLQLATNLADNAEKSVSSVYPESIPKNKVREPIREVPIEP